MMSSALLNYESPPEMVPASLWVRFIAVSYTAVIFCIGAMLLRVLWIFVPERRSPMFGAMAAAYYVLHFAYVIAFLGLAAWQRASVGMKLENLRFFAIDQEKALSTGRCLWRLILGMVLMPLFPIAIVLSMTDARRRTLADRLAGTVTVRFIDRKGPRSPRP